MGAVWLHAEAMRLLMDIHPDHEAIEDRLSAGNEWSFDQLSESTGIKPWEMTLALAHLTAREAISSRVDLSTGRHIRLYRASH